MKAKKNKISKRQQNELEWKNFVLTIKKLSVPLGSNFDAVKWLRKNR